MGKIKTGAAFTGGAVLGGFVANLFFQHNLNVLSPIQTGDIAGIFEDVSGILLGLTIVQGIREKAL